MKSVFILFVFFSITMSAEPLLYPLAGDHHGDYESSPYGIRLDPQNPSSLQFHFGIDIACPMGTEIIAVGNGTIAMKDVDPVFGLFIIIHLDSGYDVLYGHLSHAHVVKGTKVLAGDAMGKTGNSGVSTGPHLHLEVLVNPDLLLRR